MTERSSLFSGLLYLKYTKRIIDILLSLLLCAVFFIPACIIALLIKMSSKGPLFADVPERIGIHGKPFKMFKFRSMVENAHTLLTSDPRFKELYEEYKRGSYKLYNDPRVTPIGRFIRKHSLDELPQFINVLYGDMSMVGPRAYYHDELEHQQKQFPHAQKLVRNVLSVRPGITGLWQVSGRSEVNFDERIIIDAQYVDSLSLKKDLYIILKTPYVMLSGKGAV